MDKIYNGAVHDTTDFADDSELYVNSCGIQKGVNGRYTVIRENGREDFHIIYVVRGSCTVIYEGKEYILEPNSFVVYYPHQKQKYTYEGEVYAYWLHFSGKQAQDLLEKCGLGCGVFNGDNMLIKEVFEKMVKEYCTGSKLSHIKLPALLTELICDLASALDGNGKINTHIAELAAFIYSNFSENPDIDEFAKKASLSRDRFVHLFSRQIGEPPHRFLMNVRIKEAISMLRHTDLSVNEIAYGVGFSDPLYFSRVFKKHNDMSPKKYKMSISKKS